MSNEQARIVEREFARVGAPGTGQDRTQLYANTLLAKGTEALKAKLIGPILRGEIVMCLLYSEPGAGSDLAGVRTRAELDGDHYVVNGQKVWTSTAATADYGMLIARTNWDVPKHKGISFFFLPMKQPGVDVRPLRQITDESHFNDCLLYTSRLGELLRGRRRGFGDAGGAPGGRDLDQSEPDPRLSSSSRPRGLGARATGRCAGGLDAGAGSATSLAVRHRGPRRRHSDVGAGRLSADQVLRPDARPAARVGPDPCSTQPGPDPAVRGGRRPFDAWLP